MAACAAAADAAAEKHEQQQQDSEEDGQNDEREQIFDPPFTVSTGVVGRHTVAVEIIWQTASLGATGAVVTRPVRTVAAI